MRSCRYKVPPRGFRLLSLFAHCSRFPKIYFENKQILKACNTSNEDLYTQGPKPATRPADGLKSRRIPYGFSVWGSQQAMARQGGCFASTLCVALLRAEHYRRRAGVHDRGLTSVHLHKPKPPAEPVASSYLEVSYTHPHFHPVPLRSGRSRFTSNCY